jgi:hypothetical protein
MRARSASRAQDWRWSSVRAHLVGRYDGLVVVAPMLERSNRRFGDLIDAPASSEAMAALRGAETIGRARITRLPMSPRAAHGARSEALRSGVLRYKVMSCPLNRTRARAHKFVNHGAVPYCDLSKLNIS